MRDLGYHDGYQYAHDFPGGVTDLEHLPDVMRGTVYYRPTEYGYEQKIRAWNAERDRIRAQRRAMQTDDPKIDDPKGRN